MQSIERHIICFFLAACTLPVIHGQQVIQFNLTLDGEVYENNQLYIEHVIQPQGVTARSNSTMRSIVDVVCKNLEGCQYTLVLKSLELDAKIPVATRNDMTLIVSAYDIPEFDIIERLNTSVSQYRLRPGGQMDIPFQITGEGTVRLRFTPYIDLPSRRERFLTRQVDETLNIRIDPTLVMPKSEIPVADTDTIPAVEVVVDEIEKPEEEQAPPQEPPVQRPRKNAETRAYEKALASGSRDALEQFLIDYPSGEHSNAVSERLEALVPMEYSIEEIAGQLYRVHVRNAEAPLVVNKDTLNVQGLVINDGQFAASSSFEMTMRVVRPYVIDIRDVRNKRLSISLDSLAMLKASVYLDSLSGIYQVEISGGKPPYRLDLVPRDGQHTFAVKKIPNVDTSYHEIVPAELAREGLSGMFTLEVRDSRLTVVQSAATPIFIQGRGQLPDLIWLVGALVAIILIFLLVRAIYMRSQRRKEKKLEAVRQTIHERQAVQMPERRDPIIPPTGSTMTAERGRASIRITSRHESYKLKMLEIAAFKERLEKEPFYHYDLDRLWEETCVSELWLRKKCAVDLDDFLRKENLNEVRNEEAGEVPEIGGFLMGMYCPDTEDGKYMVTLDEFVPIEPERHNIYQLEFSTESLVRKLGDAQDIFPDLLVLGWFHTHPGHSLFLSRPDLVIHRGFFGERYQLAMQIDSLTEKLDLAFFTQKPSGEINNSVRKTLNWFSWKDMQAKIAE